MAGNTAVAARAWPDGHDPLADQLRGIGRLGIVVITVLFFSFGSGSGRMMAGAGEQAAVIVLEVFVFGKVLLVLSFLFGYGLQPLLTDASGTVRRIAVRRLAALGAIGLLHGLLLFPGDAMLGLAVLGFAVVALSGRSSRQLLSIAGVSVAAALVTAPLLAAIGAGAPDLASPLCADGFLASLTDRCAVYPFALFHQAVSQWGFELAAMLVGVVAARARVLSAPGPWLAMARRGLTVAAPLSLLLVGAAVVLQQRCGEACLLASGSGNPIVPIARDLGSLWGGIAYGCVLVVVLARGRRLPAVVTSAGRCSLTIGLVTSSILVLMFSSWALGWHGELSLWATLGLAVALWLGLALAAHAWLRFRPAGPVEAIMLRWAGHGRPAIP